MKRSTFIAALATSGAALVGIDQALKLAADAWLKGRPPVGFAHGLVTLIYATNPGGFLSFFAGFPGPVRTAVLVAIPLLFLAGALVWAFLRGKFNGPTLAGLALLIGGGVGNLIDRIFREGGRVVDYLLFSVGPIHTGIMNFADLCVLALIILILVLMFREDRKAAKDPTAAPPRDGA